MAIDKMKTFQRINNPNGKNRRGSSNINSNKKQQNGKKRKVITEKEYELLKAISILTSKSCI